MIRVAVVDDQELLRTGFRMVLEAQPDMKVVAEAADGLAALQVLAEVPVDVVLMDVRMPGLDGVQATERLLARDPAVRVLILTTFDLDEYVYAAVRAGASGFLLKDVPRPSCCTGSGRWPVVTRSWLPAPRAACWPGSRPSSQGP